MRATVLPSRKSYIIILSLVAVGILIGGVSLKPERAPAPVRSENDFLQLQLLAQRRDLQRRSLFFQTIAAQLVTRSQSARTHPQQDSYVAPVAGTTVLLVATESSGQPVWATTSTAGSAEITCDGRAIPEIETTITIPKTLADATAFDLDENVAAFVITCGDRRILTTPQGFEIASQPTLAARLKECCGLVLTSDPAKPGLTIAELNGDSRPGQAGLKVGDVVAEINQQPLEEEDQLAALLEPTQTVLSVQRGRSRRLNKITIPAPDVPAQETER
jgi:hypothetical protein